MEHDRNQGLTIQGAALTLPLMRLSILIALTALLAGQSTPSAAEDLGQTAQTASAVVQKSRSARKDDQAYQSRIDALMARIQHADKVASDYNEKAVNKVAEARRGMTGCVHILNRGEVCDEGYALRWATIQESIEKHHRTLITLNAKLTGIGAFLRFAHFDQAAVASVEDEVGVCERGISAAGNEIDKASR